MKPLSIADAIPGRRHKCEGCGDVYVCEECTAIQTATRARALYSSKHAKTDIESPLWLCPECDKSAMRRCETCRRQYRRRLRESWIHYRQRKHCGAFCYYRSMKGMVGRNPWGNKGRP